MAKVLLVDDDVDLLEALVSILTDTGHQVQAVASGEAALATLSQLEDGKLPQIIITDLKMSGMTGLQLLEMMRADTKYCHIPCLIISASLSPELEQQLTQFGGVASLRKPFDVKLFCGTVNALCQND